MTCAGRELFEETGFQRRDVDVPRRHRTLSPGFTDEYMHLFGARTRPEPEGEPEARHRGGADAVRRRGRGRTARDGSATPAPPWPSCSAAAQPGRDRPCGAAVPRSAHRASVASRRPHDRRVSARPRSLRRVPGARGIASPTEVEPADVRSFVASISAATHGPEEAPYAATSVARALSAVRSFHRFLVRDGVTDRDPSAGVVRPRLPRALPHPLSVDEVRAIVEAPDPSQRPAGMRDRAILELLYGAGLRYLRAHGAGRRRRRSAGRVRPGPREGRQGTRRPGGPLRRGTPFRPTSRGPGRPSPPHAPAARCSSTPGAAASTRQSCGRS